MLSDRPRHRESAADASFPVRLRDFPGARAQPSRRKALGELPGSLRLARRCSTKRKRLMTACQPRGLPRTWTPARRWGQGWCARSPLATVTAHGQRSEVCRARRHRVHRQRAYCYRRRWPTGRCRRSNPARRCVSRDGPHLAEHSVKHPVKHSGCASSNRLHPVRVPFSVVGWDSRRMVFHMMDSAMSLLALGELEELVSDTQRGGGVEFARLALEHLRFLPVADDVGAVEGTVVLDPQRAVLIDADRGMIA